MRKRSNRFWTPTEAEPCGNERGLLLHSCCAPCSTSVIEVLKQFEYDVTVYFYNPNIVPWSDYELRRDTQRRFCGNVGVPFVCGDYDNDVWQKYAGALPFCEGGARCGRCIEMRVNASAQYAALHGFDFVTTTLSVSPHKSAEMVNGILERACAGAGVLPLFGNLKKQGGFQRGTELSRRYELYRQDYCGCKPNEKYYR